MRRKKYKEVKVLTPEETKQLSDRDPVAFAGKIAEGKMIILEPGHRSYLFSLRGWHIGWFDDCVISDRDNRALAFTRDHTGHLPYTPGTSGTPGMPGLSGTPGRPGFSGTPGRPGLGGWSSHDAAAYFSK
jgi:hypothetical protein